MKHVLLYTLSLFLTFNVFSQGTKELLIIPSKTGVLTIDGISKGIVEANDVSKQILTFGEHYLQLKTDDNKINITLNVDSTTKTIFKIDCNFTSEINPVRLISKQVSLGGALVNDTEKNIIGLDKDDEIVINCSVLNKKGNATLFITEVNKGNEIYRKQAFTLLEDEKIKITTKGIYKIDLYTDALFGKEARLTIDRIPSKNSSVAFNTNPRLVYDTTYTEVLKTVSRVYSVGNLDHPNKTAIAINLPANTSYWTYWIGVDQGAQEGMKNFITNLSPMVSMFSANPLVLYGMKLIPSLPMMNTPSTVNYKFMSSVNARAFLNGQAYSYYKLKYADNITTDYSLIKDRVPEIILAMENLSALTGYNVEIRVVAFVIKSKLELEE